MAGRFWARVVLIVHHITIKIPILRQCQTLGIQSQSLHRLLKPLILLIIAHQKHLNILTLRLLTLLQLSDRLLQPLDQARLDEILVNLLLVSAGIRRQDALVSRLLGLPLELQMRNVLKKHAVFLVRADEGASIIGLATRQEFSLACVVDRAVSQSFVHQGASLILIWII